MDPKDTQGKSGIMGGVTQSADDTQTPAAPTTPNVSSGVFSGSKGMGETTAPSMGSMAEPPVSTPMPPAETVDANVSNPATSVPEPMSSPTTGMGTASTSPLGSVPEPEDTSTPGTAVDTPTEEEVGGTGGTGGGTGKLGE